MPCALARAYPLWNPLSHDPTMLAADLSFHQYVNLAYLPKFSFAKYSSYTVQVPNSKYVKYKQLATVQLTEHELYIHSYIYTINNFALQGNRTPLQEAVWHRQKRIIHYFVEEIKVDITCLDQVRNYLILSPTVQ